jgi:hypothetical protein
VTVVDVMGREMMSGDAYAALSAVAFAAAFVMLAAAVAILLRATWQAWKDRHGR